MLLGLGIFELSRSQHRLIMHIVSIFLRTDKIMIGLWFSGGPFFSPGFGNGVKMPICISDGGFHSFDVVLNIFAMLFCMEVGAYLICSALIDFIDASTFAILHAFDCFADFISCE